MERDTSKSWTILKAALFIINSLLDSTNKPHRISVIKTWLSFSISMTKGLHAEHGSIYSLISLLISLSNMLNFFSWQGIVSRSLTQCFILKGLCGTSKRGCSNPFITITMSTVRWTHWVGSVQIKRSLTYSGVIRLYSYRLHLIWYHSMIAMCKSFFTSQVSTSLQSILTSIDKQDWI